MIVNKSTPIWKASGRSSDNRPILEYVLVERLTETTGLLVAANGFILAVVPCKLRPEDVPGIIHRRVLKRAGKLARYSVVEEQVLLEAETAVLSDGTAMRRIDPSHEQPRPGVVLITKDEKGVVEQANQESAKPSLVFPAWRKVVAQAKRLSPDERFRGTLAFSGRLYGQLCRAICPTPVSLLTVGALASGPLLVETQAADPGTGCPIPPFGVLMPQHVDDTARNAPAWDGVFPGAATESGVTS